MTEPASISLDPAGISRLMRQAEADYNLRRRHPERETVYGDYAARSERLRRERGCRSLVYGASPRNTIDWFESHACPAGRPPLLVFFHGGFWRGGDKAVFSFIAEPFLDAGISVALAGYDLAPAVTITEIVRQAKQALRWLAENSDPLGFDRDRVTVSGHSAGGHLAAILGSAMGTAGEGTVAGVVGLSGLYALQPFLLSSVNLEARMTLDEAESLSPATFEHFTAKRFLLAVGSKETNGFVEQTRMFSDRLEAIGIDQQLQVCQDRTHFDIFEDMVSPGAPLLERMLAFIGNPAQQRA